MNSHDVLDCIAPKDWDHPPQIERKSGFGRLSNRVGQSGVLMNMRDDTKGVPFLCLLFATTQLSACCIFGFTTERKEIWRHSDPSMAEWQTSQAFTECEAAARATCVRDTLAGCQRYVADLENTQLRNPSTGAVISDSAARNDHESWCRHILSNSAAAKRVICSDFSLTVDKCMTQAGYLRETREVLACSPMRLF